MRRYADKKYAIKEQAGQERVERHRDIKARLEDGDSTLKAGSRKERRAYKAAQKKGKR